MTELFNRCSVWIIIPAYNEEKSIGGVVSELRSTGHKVLVIDDGSNDETRKAAAIAGAAVLRHMINLGQGAALQTGIDCALRLGAEYIVTFDADGQHATADVEKLLAALTTDGAEFALGSRFLGNTSAIPPGRKALLWVAVWFTRLTTSLKITDAHNGLRAMTRKGAGQINLRQNRMAHASEILHQIGGSRLRYTEVPVTISYTAYSLAKGQRSSNAISILLELVAGRLSR